MTTKPANPESPYLTMPELCSRYAGASRGWVYNAISTGDIPAPIRIGGKVLFERAAVVQRDTERLNQARLATAARREAREMA